MTVYLVTWDLNEEKPNYAAARAAFVGRLDKYETIRDPGLDSVRFVSTTSTTEQLANDLRKAMDDNDKLIVTKLVRGDYFGWLNKAVWEWISTRL